MARSTKWYTRWSFGAAIAAAAMVLVATAFGQYTAIGLYEYPITNNNTYGIPNTSLMAQGADGNLYMSDVTDGQYGQGSVYNISPSGAFSTLYSFCGEAGACATSGRNPSGGVTLGSDGNFYGTVPFGGSHGAGQVFRLTPAGVHTAVYNFTGAVPGDGGTPNYPVFMVGADLWGVQDAYCGGPFKLTLAGKISNFPFDCANGSNPNLFTQGSDGNFYGTTSRGGYAGCGGCGVIYKVTTAGKIKVLYTFQGTTDGAYPQGVLVEGTDGNYWGITTAGNPNYGVIFKISPSGEFNVVHTFTGGVNGGGAPAGLTLGSDGNFYGIAEGGPNNAGMIFQVTPSGTFTTLYGFVAAAGPPGFGPCTALFQNTNGKFYGNTCGNSLGDTGFFYSIDVGLGPFIRTLSQAGKVGQKIEIFGQDFTGTTNVEFGGASATFAVVSATELTAVIPAAAVTGAVKVITSTGTLTALSNFKVLPTITSINPTSGAVGSTVTITGKGLTGATKVTIGGKTASFTVNSSTQITATVPTGAVSGKKVTVTTPGGTVSSASAFTVT